MKRFLTILLLCPLLLFGQSETNNFTLYDTTFSSSLGLGESWTAAIWRPVNLFTTGNADTASRPLILMIQGDGQFGTSSYSNLSVYGPMYWLANGWDGSVQLGNGTHYPIIITLNAATNTYPDPYQLYPIMQYILQHYHIKPGCVYGTGLSYGAFLTGGMIEYEQTLGDQLGMKVFNALADFEGTPLTPWSSFPTTPSYCDTAWCDTVFFKQWAKVYNGKYFYLEGSGSDNFRDGWHYAQAMNDTVPNSAYFSYEDDGGGAHCCWNDFYNPAVTNWTTGTTFGTYTSASQLGTDVMGDYHPGTNVYQWMLEQGDTSLVGSGATPPTVSASASPSTITLPTSSVSLTGSATPVSPATSISTYAWTQTSGPNTGMFSSTSIASPTFSGLIAGTYMLNLAATDNNGNTGNGTVTITVNAATSPCHVYYWDSTNINIALTNANYPSINPCDTIYVDACKPQAGYRSLVINLSAATPWKYSTLDSNRINLIFRNPAAYGTILPNSTGNLFANSITASSLLLIQGLKMYDHTDPLFSSVTQTGYLHHIKFVKDTIQNVPGLWTSGPITTSLPNFTGANDTVNCNYDIWFHQCVFDSIGGVVYGGLDAMWLGGFNANQVWVKTEIDSSYFNYAPSPSGAGPACFVHCQQCYAIKIHDNTFSNLGVVAVPSGHAASIFMQGSLYNIYHNIFKINFSNCVRAISQGTVPAMTALFKSWDPNYDGVSRFWGNILDSGRKYPMVEAQKDTIGFTGLPYWQAERSPRIWNNTMYRGGAGVGDQPYNVSLFDWYQVAYTNDTLEMHNNIEIGPPMDTSATMCYSQACVALLTQPSGTTPYHVDSSGNQFYQLMTLATSGMQDATTFRPIYQGLMYNNGVSVPTWLTTDFYGKPVPQTGRPSFARSSGVDVGAVQYQYVAPTSPCTNCIISPRRIIFH